MHEPSSHLEADQFIMARDAPLASSFLLEQNFKTDVDNSCHSDSGFLSPPSSNNLSSQIMLDFGSPSRELSCTEGFSSGWETPPVDMLQSCSLLSGWESLSQDPGMDNIKTFDFTNNFASIEYGYDSFPLAEEPSDILGSPEICNGMAPQCNSENTSLHIASNSADTAPTRLGDTTSLAVHNARGAEIRLDIKKSRKQWSKTQRTNVTDPIGSMASQAVICHKTSLCPKQKISSSIPGPDSVTILQSESPTQENSDQFANLCESDTLPDTQASGIGKPSDTFRRLDISAFLDGLDNYDTQCDFEQTTSLNTSALLDNCDDLESFHDALAESSRHLEAFVFENQYVSNFKVAEENLDMKSYQQHTVSNNKTIRNTCDVKKQYVSLPEQSDISIETAQGAIPDSLEHLLLSVRQTGFDDDHKDGIPYLYSTSFDKAQIATCSDSAELPGELEKDSSTATWQNTSAIFLSQQPDSKSFDGAVLLDLGMDVFTTTCKISSDQCLQSTKPSYINSSCNIGVEERMSQVIDANAVYTSQPSGTTTANSNTMSVHDRVGFPQVLMPVLDTVTASLHDAIVIQPEGETVPPGELHQTAEGQAQSSLGITGYNGTANVHQTKTESVADRTEDADPKLHCLSKILVGSKQITKIHDQPKQKRGKFQIQSPKYFPPRVYNKDNSVGVENNPSSPVEEQLDAENSSPETLSLKTPLPVKQYHENIYIFPFDIHRNGKTGEVACTGELSPQDISGEDLRRISTYLSLQEACKAKSTEAHKKLKALKSTDCIGRVHTERGDFYCNGQYLHRKTVRQMLKEAGFQQKNDEVEMKLPVGKSSHKNRLKKNAHISLNVGNKQQCVSGKKRKAEEELQIESPKHRKPCALRLPKVLCYSKDRLSQSSSAKNIYIKPGKEAGEQQPVFKQTREEVESQWSMAVNSHNDKEKGSQFPVTNQVGEEVGSQLPVISRVSEETGSQFPFSSQMDEEMESQLQVTNQTGKEIRSQLPATSQMDEEIGNQFPITNQTFEETPNQLPVTSQMHKETESQPSVTRQMDEETESQCPVTRQMDEKIESQLPFTNQTIKETGNQLPVTSQMHEETESQLPVTSQMHEETESQLPVTRQMDKTESQLSITRQMDEETGSQLPITTQMRKLTESQLPIIVQLKKGAEQNLVTSQMMEETGVQQSVNDLCMKEAENQLPDNHLQRKETENQHDMAESQQSATRQCGEIPGNQQPFTSQCQGEAKTAQPVSCQIREEAGRQIYAIERSSQQKVSNQEESANKQSLVSHQHRVKSKVQQLVNSDNSVCLQEESVQKSTAEQHSAVSLNMIKADSQQQPVITHHSKEGPESQQTITSHYEEDAGSQQSSTVQQVFVSQFAQCQRQSVVSHLKELAVAEQEPFVSQHQEMVGNQDQEICHRKLHKEETGSHQSAAKYEPGNWQCLIKIEIEKPVKSHSNLCEESQQLNCSHYREEAKSQQSVNSQLWDRAGNEWSIVASSHHCEKPNEQVATRQKERIMQVKNQDTEELESHMVSSQHTEKTESHPFTSACMEKQTVAEKQQVATCHNRRGMGNSHSVTSQHGESTDVHLPVQRKKGQTSQKVDLVEECSFLSNSSGNKTPSCSDSLCSLRDISDEEAIIVCCSTDRDTVDVTEESRLVGTEGNAVVSSFMVTSDLDVNALPVVRKFGKVTDSETIHNGEIETLYRSPFLLVVHQAGRPSSTSPDPNSGVIADEIMVEQAGKMRVCIENTGETTSFGTEEMEWSQSVANDVHQVQNTVNPGDAIMILDSVSQHQENVTAENSLCAVNSLFASVPDCTADLSDLTYLLESNGQGVERYKSENGLVLETSDHVNYVGNQLQCSSVEPTVDAHRADPVGVFGDRLSSSSNYFSDRAESASSSQLYCTEDNVCAALSTRTLPSKNCFTKPLQFSFQDVSSDEYYDSSVECFPILGVMDRRFHVNSSENSQQYVSHSLSLGSRVADFEDCASITGLEDFIGDCLLGTANDFVEDFGLQGARGQQGNTSSLSTCATDNDAEAVNTIGTQNVTREEQMYTGFFPDGNSKETCQGTTALGTPSTSTLRKDINLVEDIVEHNQDVQIPCQTNCKDAPSCMPSQISEREYQDIFMFESRGDVNTVMPTLARTESPKLEFAVQSDFRPVGLKFTVPGFSEWSNGHGSLGSSNLKADSLLCGAAENCLEASLCADSVCVGTKQNCGIQHGFRANETDPLEVWMETVHSSGDCTCSLDINGEIKNDSVTDTIMTNSSSHQWNPSFGIPEIKCQKNHLLCPSASLTDLDSIISSAQASASFSKAKNTCMSFFEDHPELAKTNNTIHGNSSLSVDPSFEMLLESFRLSRCCSASGSQSILCGPSEGCANQTMQMENLFPRKRVQDSCPTIVSTEHPCPASNPIHNSDVATPAALSHCLMTVNSQTIGSNNVKNKNIEGVKTMNFEVPCHAPTSMYVSVPESQSGFTSVDCGEFNVPSLINVQGVHGIPFNQNQIHLSAIPLRVSHGLITQKTEDVSQTIASRESYASHINFHGSEIFTDTVSTHNKLQKLNNLIVKGIPDDKTDNCITASCCPVLSCPTSLELQAVTKAPTPLATYKHWMQNSLVSQAVMSSTEVSRSVTLSSIASSSTDSASSSSTLSPLLYMLEDQLPFTTCHPVVSCSSNTCLSVEQTIAGVVPPPLCSSVENILSSASHISSLNNSSASKTVFLDQPSLVSSSSIVSSMDIPGHPILGALLSSTAGDSPVVMPVLPASLMFSQLSDSSSRFPDPAPVLSSSSSDLSPIADVLPEPSLCTSSSSNISLSSNDTLAAMRALAALSPLVPPSSAVVPALSLPVLSRSGTSEPTDISSRTSADGLSKNMPFVMNVTENEDNTCLSRSAEILPSSCPTEKVYTPQLADASPQFSSDTSLSQSVQSLLLELDVSGSLMPTSATTCTGSCQSETRHISTLRVLPQSLPSQVASPACSEVWHNSGGLLTPPDTSSLLVVNSASKSTQPSVSHSCSDKSPVLASLAGSSSGLCVSISHSVPFPNPSPLFGFPQSSVAGCAHLQKCSRPLTLSSKPASALWTSSMKFVVTPVPPNRFQPSCPCHPLMLDSGRESLPCIPFSPAMLNCPTMVAAPCVAARPQDLPQNPSCIGKDLFEYSPSAKDIHMAQMLHTKAIERNAKAPARHCMTYTVDTICIGDFTSNFGRREFTVNGEKYSKDSSIWISYLKKKLCYNMVFTQSVDDPNCWGHRRVVRTEILFSTIIGLWGCGNKILLELSSPPAMFLQVSGQAHCKLKPKQRKAIDITGGQMRKSPYHFLTFTQQVAESVKRNLCDDPDFCNLLIRPVTVDLNKTYPTVVSKEKDSSEIFCMCKGTCQHLKCRCFKLKQQCRGNCLCQNCQNQFNQLHGLRFPLSEVYADPCLMDRLSQVKDVRKFLETPVCLECCGVHTTFLHCTPGRQQCHKCAAYLKLSWCLARVFIDSVIPRNHCKQCKRCVKVFMRHCEACGRCTKQDPKGNCLSCVHKMNCQNALETLTPGKN